MKTIARRLALAVGTAAVLAVPGFAAPFLPLQFPGPSETTAQRTVALASFRLAIGPYRQGSIATQLTEGRLEQSAWRIAAPALTTLELTQALRAQLAAAGFKVLFECETEACGGFDFRYGTDVLPEPDMHIDLGDFRYLAAERAGPAGKEYLGLMVSRSPQSGFVQLTRIGGAADALLTASTKSPLLPASPQSLALPLTPGDPLPDDLTDLGKRLDLGQPQVLADLAFASGSASLAAGDYASLRDLAAWLQANPTKTVLLVGHTDASGGLAANVSLSKQRAESVRQVLLASFDIPAAQVAANGVGPLAPRETNLSDAGRQKNRRVEVVITSTQ